MIEFVSMKAVLGSVSGKAAESEVVLGIGGAWARCEVNRDSARQPEFDRRRRWHEGREGISR